MRKILKIAVREYNEAVRTKAFVIGIIFAPIMMGGSGLAMWLTEEQVDTVDKRIAVIDRTDIVSESLLEAVKERNETGIHDEETGVEDIIFHRSANLAPEIFLAHQIKRQIQHAVGDFQ